MDFPKSKEFSKIKKIDELWNEAKQYPKPKVFIALYNDRFYLTASDNKTIKYFVSPKGKVYATAAKNCSIIHYNEIETYLITPNTLKQISCTKPKENVDFFVFSKLIPIFFKAN